MHHPMPMLECSVKLLLDDQNLLAVLCTEIHVRDTVYYLCQMASLGTKRYGKQLA